MDYVTFLIAVVGFLLSIYTFTTTRLGRRPRLEIFRFEPERIVIDDDFNTLHVYTDADFIITNLSEKPNTIIKMEASIYFGSTWLEGIVNAKQLSESTRTRTDYGSEDGTPRHHNEIVREWVNTDVCPIMLSPQESGIPNKEISLRLDFQSSEAITDVSRLRLRIALLDQYGTTHSFDVSSESFERLQVDHYPKFHHDEEELGKRKDLIPNDDMSALVRVVLRRYEENLAQSTLTVRRYYPTMGERRLTNVSHIGRDGYAYNSFRPRDFQKHLREDGNGVRELEKVDGFRIAFTVSNGLPSLLSIELPESWKGERLEIPIPDEFAQLCVANA